VTSDFKLLFPVHHPHVPTPPQYFCLGWNPVSNSEAGGRGLEGHGTGETTLCIAFCRENRFSIKVVRSSSRYPQNLSLLHDEVERTSLNTSAGLPDDMTDGGASANRARE